MAQKEGSIEDPRDKFFAEIDILSSHINLTPPTVLFFGGPHESTPNGIASSVRGHVLKYCSENNLELHSHFVIPDKFRDWGIRAGYSDLLNFETDMALMSTAIILMPESAGSIAELGAFVVNEHVRSKLMVILPDTHFNSDSFIRSALIPRIADEQVYTYDYDPQSLLRLDELVVDIVRDIDQVATLENHTEKFDQANFGHFSYCVYQIIKECRAVKFEEIRLFLRSLNLPDDRADVVKALYLLDVLNFIAKIRKGNETFHFPLGSRASDRVRFSSARSGDHLDKMTFKVELARYYKASDKDRYRRQVIDGQIQRRER